MVDPRSRRHPLEQAPFTRVRNLVDRPIDEGMMDVVVGSGAGNRADGDLRWRVRHDVGFALGQSVNATLPLP
jgi:hypothetical protein